jgi:hypothetical protein
MDMMDYDYNDEDPFVNQPDDGSSGNPLGAVLGGLTSNPLYFAIAAFVVGVLFGWLAIGWGVWPVEWTDASPIHLADKYQRDYMSMVIDSYNLRNDLPTAQQRISVLEDKGPVILQEMANNPSDILSQATVNMFLEYYSATGDLPAAGDETTAPQPATGNGEGVPTDTGNLLMIACGVVVVLAAALVGLYFFRSRRRQPAGMTAAARAQEYTRQAQQTDYEAMGEDAPIAQWMTTYLIGDDLFDDSFSIDSPSGEFLGECGLGIADTIGVGEPKRVSAFEVWLFDKNDIQTVTKVLMSGHAYNDEGSHNRLAAKGEPSLAVPNGEVILETKTLRMVARVMDMDYGTGHLPENSFFQRITLELAIWPK